MNQNLRPAGSDLIERLTSALGREAVSAPEGRYLEEPRGRFAGTAAAVVRPACVEDVVAVVRLCAEARVGIVPYSGGTGLVGGQTLSAGPLPILISFERMARVRDVDRVDNVLVAEAGAILADVHAAALDADRLFPLTLASEGSARIGGLMATNAGGVNVLRYGNARDLCLGIEAVMADGADSAIGPRFEAALADALEAGLAGDALIAQNRQQRAAFWTVRETIPEANRRIGSISSHDVSLPPGRVADFIAAGGPAIAAIDGALRINCFGHLGDGNLHYNVFPPKGRPRSDFDALRELVKTTVHDLVHSMDGSVGAEHGVGRLKTGDMTRYCDPGKLAAMRAIKMALDPLGILNPGAVLPDP